MKNYNKYLFLACFIFSFDVLGQAIDPSILSQLSPEQIEMAKDAYAGKNSTDKSVEELPVIDESLVTNKSAKDANKIGYLQTLEEQYGEQYGRVLNELTAEGLPVTAKLVSYFNDENFAILATSIDTEEERTRLDNFLKTQTNLSFKDINESVADELEDFRNSVMFSNKMNTTKANDELEDIQNVITYIAINKMSANMKEGKAIKEATNYINNNDKYEQQLRYTALAVGGAALSYYLYYKYFHGNKGKDIRDDVGDMLVVLINILKRNDLTLESCLEVAWSDIKDRKGKMVDGIFVKD